MIDTVRTADAILEKARIDREEYRERFFWEDGDVRVSQSNKPEPGKAPLKKEAEKTKRHSKR